VALENIYQMYVRVGKAAFFVKRNGWSHPYTVARVLSVGGLTQGPLVGDPPYFSNLVVLADMSYQGRICRERLRCPGTYAYLEVSDPKWWPVAGSNGREGSLR
jgi:hypothetical protein